jgi:predicted small secreted protein
MKTVVTFIFVALSMTFAACSTVAGVGKDITSAAEWTKEKVGGR